MWAWVLIACAGAFALKLAGYLVPQELLDKPRIRHISMLMPIALLSALVAIQTFASDQSLVLDARAAGLAAAIVALILRAPFIVVVLVAAATAAGLRAVGLAA